MKHPKSVLYIGVDSFYSQIEKARNPETAERPVIVVKERGRAASVVVCASPDAIQQGISIGMGIRRARRKSPDAAVIRADFEIYRDVFDNMLDILSQYTPLLEPGAPGFAYMDVTGSRNLFGNAEKISLDIIQQIKQILGLNARAGSGSNKLIATSAFLTGDSLLSIRPEDEPDFLKEQSVNTLFFIYSQISKAYDIEKRLNELGIRKIGQLAGIPESLLVKQFGKDGSILHRLAHGIDESGVEAKHPRQIINIEHMCEYELSEPDEVEIELDNIASKAYNALKAQNMLAGEAFLKLYWDSESIPGYFRFKSATDSRESILYALVKILRDRMKPGMLIHKIEVNLLYLEKGLPVQLCLFGAGEREYKTARTVDMIRSRFGDKSISSASVIG